MSTSGWSSVPLTMTMGVGTWRMIWRVASSPSMPGIRTSMVMTLGRMRFARRTASWPLVPTPTT
ncbi:MAG: hypothetical protein GX597_06350 [Anaerolineaceae bacterium]|nr:hypothetical protein [Anaerolineaceae bacterium]